MYIKSFAFNPFQENTYVIWDDMNQCAIIDPGCFQANEQRMLSDFIDSHNLKPVMLLQTHAHLDHVFGTAFVHRHYKLIPMLHALERPVYESAEKVGLSYGVPVEKLPEASYSLEHGKEITLGNITLEIRFTPGHSPGSVCFINHDSKTVVAGDVLFSGSIGRTDLPGGNYQTLINSIQDQLLPLADNFTVFSGHGPSTTIGAERMHNPFLS